MSGEKKGEGKAGRGKGEGGRGGVQKKESVTGQLEN